MHDESRYTNHLMKHWDYILLERHGLDLSLIRDPH